MEKFAFKIHYESKKSQARIGTIHTSQGTIQTPAFVPVATKGTLKAIPPSVLTEIGVQSLFMNIYHLALHPGINTIKKAGGIHNYSGLNIPLFTDSGGFQVFSLAQHRKKAKLRDDEQPLVLKISEDGVTFRSVYDGSIVKFTPEKSVQYQEDLGSDIIMAFDECTYYQAAYDYTQKAMQRTHNWAKRCLIEKVKIEKQKSEIKSALYGIVQGGMYEDLRKQSTEFIAQQNFAGIAIGGVSVGETKREIREQVKWVKEALDTDSRPRHLLGVGQIDDILDLVKYGIDSFDCVEPTRLARMGKVYINNSTMLDLTKGVFKNDLSPLDKDCGCYSCSNFTRSYLHLLFKQRELLGYFLATFHNLYFIEKLMARVRKAIQADMI